MYNQFNTKLKHFAPDEILRALKRQLVEFEAPSEAFRKLEEIWDSRFWTNKGYNGANIIRDKFLPWCFPFFHDYYWRTGKGGRKSDIISIYFARKTGVSKFWCKTYLKGLGIGWSFPLIGYKSKHKRKGNIKPFNELDEALFIIAEKYLISEGIIK